MALKSKRGELDALQHLRPEEAATTTFMIELLDTVAVADSAQILPALIRAAIHLAEHGGTLWIDTHWLSITSPLARQPGGPFEFLDQRIEAALQDVLGLLAPDSPALIPVVSLNAGDDGLRAIALLQEHRQRDVVVRIRNPLPRPRELADRLDRVTSRTRVLPGRLHAVLDLGFVESVRDAQVEVLSQLVPQLEETLGPGSTTLLAGSIPAERVGFVTTTRDRPEVTLWRAVAAESPKADVQYGDYGVVHPTPPRSGDPGPRVINPYLYYTVPGRTIALRKRLERDGRKPVPGAAVEAFTELAEELVDRPEFTGTAYSWGDRELAQCRRGGGKVAGSVPRWIAMATSHHLAHVSQRPSADL